MSDEEECQHEYEYVEIVCMGSPESRMAHVCIHCDWEDEGGDWYDCR